MNEKLDGIKSDMWESLVAAVCEEYQKGGLEFSDAVEDLLFLGFESDEAGERLNVVAAAGVKERDSLKLICAQEFLTTRSRTNRSWAQVGITYTTMARKRQRSMPLVG